MMAFPTLILHSSPLISPPSALFVLCLFVQLHGPSLQLLPAACPSASPLRRFIFLSANRKGRVGMRFWPSASQAGAIGGRRQSDRFHAKIGRKAEHQRHTVLRFHLWRQEGKGREKGVNWLPSLLFFFYSLPHGTYRICSSQTSHRKMALCA